MKVQLRTTIFLVLLSLILLAVPVFVQAGPPVQPSGFYGEVKIDGANVPDGTQVSAWINGILYAQTTTITDAGVSVYVLNVPGDDPDTPNAVEGGVSGNTITFYVGGQPATPTGTWQSGSNIQLNLSRTLIPPVGVALPSSASGKIGASVTIPLSVTTSLTGLNVLAYQFTLTYDPDIIQFTGIAKNGTLSASFDVQYNETAPGTLLFAAAGGNYLSGSGVLLNLLFSVLTDSGGATSALALTNFIFNAGSPPAQTTNGNFTANPLSISGTVTYTLTGAPISGATVDLSGPHNTSATANASGAYTLAANQTGSYVVVPAKQGDLRSAISALDATQILQHTTSTIILSGDQRIAADVDLDGAITPYDAGRIARYLAGLTSDIALAGKWHFSPQSRSYPSLTSDQSGQNYGAYLFGDVSGDWGSAVQAQAANSSLPTISLPTMVAFPNKVFNLLVAIDTYDSTVLGYKIHLVFDPNVLQFQAVVTEGSLSDGWPVVVNDTVPGELILVGYTSQPFSASGTLLNLHFAAVGQMGAESDMRLKYLRINEYPAAEEHDTGSGHVTIGAYQIFLPRMSQ